MELISDILKKYDTDKNNGHHYGEGYNQLFEKFDRNAPLNILEIGTQRGGSLAAWREYFPNAKITGLDIVDQVTQENRRGDINYVICDVNKYETDETFDIVIDDGSHWLKDVIPATVYFCHRLRVGGVMIIEDCQTPDVWVAAVREVLTPGWEYNKGYYFAVKYMDLRDINGQHDDFLIAIDRRK